MLSYLKRYKGLVFLNFISVFGFALTELGIPTIISRMVDGGVASGDREYLLKKAEIELIKKQMNDSVKLSNEYSRMRKWNHDIENHMMSVRYLMESQKYEEAKQYTDSVLSQFNQIR